MSKLSKVFPIITLEGYSASSFSELFKTAKEFMGIVPGCQVQFMFNGTTIVLNDDSTEEDSWKQYTSGKEFQER